VDKFIMTFGDAHIYNNHRDQVFMQLNRTPSKLPTIQLNPEVTDLLAFTYADITLVGYKAQPSIKADIAV
jgi:thymidylate synthase